VNPHFQSALWAGVIALVLVVGPSLVMDGRLSAQWLDAVLAAPTLPAFWLATFIGVRGGPDGLPHPGSVYGLTFVLLWALIDLMYAAWRWTRRT
jgi:hypothetical protein